MKAAELRIGNFVNLPNSGVQTVFSIARLELKVALGIHDVYNSEGKILPFRVSHIEEYEGIPLTTENLTRNRFKTEMGQFWLDGICIFFEQGEFYFLNYQRWYDDSYIETKVEIKYFHQLQNLFVDLRAKQLTTL